MPSGGGQNTVQTTTQELAPEQRELLKGVIPIAKDFLAKPPQQFQGSGIAPFTPLQQAAQGMTVNAAQGMLPFTQGIPQQLQQILGGFGGNVNAIGQNAQAGNQQLNSIMQAMGGAAAGTGQQVNQGTQGTLGALGQQFGNIQGLAGNTAGQVQQGIQQGNAASAPGLGFLTGGAVLNPDANPALRAATEAAIRPFTENFQNTILPSIAQDAVASGGFGGTRQGIAEGLAAQALLRQTGDISSNMANQAYAQGLQAMTQGMGIQQQQTGQNLNALLQSGQLTNQAASQIMQGILSGGQLHQQGALGAGQLQQGAFGQMIQGNLGGQAAGTAAASAQQQGLQGMLAGLGQSGNILQQGLLPAQLTSAVGEQQQAMQQAQLSEQIQKFVNQQILPFAAAQDVASLAFGIPGGTSTSNATTSGGGGGALPFLQAGVGIMSALPALLGLFSDRKLKWDVDKVGELKDGLGVYTFRYLDSYKMHIGLMADEVKKKYPYAVVKAFGFDLVMYGLVPTWNRS